MTASSNSKQKLTDSCPKQEAEVQDSLGPCGASESSCEVQEESECSSCE